MSIKIGETEQQFYINIAKRKRAYAGHVLRRFCRIDAVLILEDKINGSRASQRKSKSG